MNVKWNVNIFKADANKVYAEIQSIGEQVTPKQIVEYARNEDTELHKCFEWNDEVAAEKFRIEQAKQVIRTLYIVPEKKDAQPIRVMHITEQRNVYQPTQLFLSNENEYDALLKRALKELEAFKNKYKNLIELETIFEEIEEVLTA